MRVMRAAYSWQRAFLICRPCWMRQTSVHTWESPRNNDVEAQRAAARRLLGVPANATPKQLQEAYTREALRWHPDRHIASAAVEETAAASLRFQGASNALAVLLQAEAERTGTKTWVYNKVENCWEWGLANDEQQRMHQPGIPTCTYDGSQGFSPIRSYRPPWASESDDGASRTQKMHDGAWWDASWDAGAHDGASTSSSGSSSSSSEQSKRLWYLMLPVIAFLLFKNAVAVAFISAGPLFLLAPDETIERARAAAATSRSQVKAEIE